MGRIFCASDFHGMYDLWSQIRDYMQSDDELYYLGDVADRGSCGIMILKEMMADPRVHYIIGNHDEFLMKHLEERFGMRDEDLMRGNGVEGLWFCNGGQSTKIELDCDCTEAEHKEIYAYLKNAPYKVEFDRNGKHFVLTHSGFTPWDRSFATTDARIIKDNYVWNRDHFPDEWKDEWNGDDYSKWVEIHGHTPSQLLKSVRNAFSGREVTMFNMYGEIPDTDTPIDVNIIRRYCDGHKVDIDLCSFVSHKAALFDIDTMSATYFKCKGECED